MVAKVLDLSNTFKGHDNNPQVLVCGLDSMTDANL
jgi:hypothetical protein